MAGMLYLVPTPIGNLGDISQRCRQTLEEADFIAAEDTRVTLKLLNHLGIKKSLISYYEHNKAQKGNAILERILAGETCALVSDAGSPAISDPGEDLVKQCAAAGKAYTVFGDIAGELGGSALKQALYAFQYHLKGFFQCFYHFIGAYDHHLRQAGNQVSALNV